MFKWIKGLFLGRDLNDVLNETSIIKVHGIRFRIKKTDPTSFLDGSKAMLQCFDTYKIKTNADVPAMTSAAMKKIQEHYTDVFMSAVISPKLVRKKEEAKDGSIFVEHLFTEWELANELYAKIVEFTYGKKKFKLAASLATS